MFKSVCLGYSLWRTRIAKELQMQAGELRVCIVAGVANAAALERASEVPA
jgi:hypothetical protein